LDLGQARTATLTGTELDEPPLDPPPPLLPPPAELLAAVAWEAGIMLGVGLASVCSNAVGTVNICPDTPVTTGDEGSTVAVNKVTATAIGVPADVEIELDTKNTAPVVTAFAGLIVTGTVVGWPAESVPTESVTTGVTGSKVITAVVG
jgi:hypothetical protein